MSSRGAHSVQWRSDLVSYVREEALFRSMSFFGSLLLEFGLRSEAFQLGDVNENTGYLVRLVVVAEAAHEPSNLVDHERNLNRDRVGLVVKELVDLSQYLLL